MPGKASSGSQKDLRRASEEFQGKSQDIPLPKTVEGMHEVPPRRSGSLFRKNVDLFL